VTDADLALGRIPHDTVLPGFGRLDSAAAHDALERAGVTAAGVVAVVDAAMERAVRVVTVEQGIDPRALALVAFGGAGPLHACAIAQRLGMRTVIVPPRAGVFSAVGLVCSPEQRELVRTWPTPRSTDGLGDARAALAAAAGSLLARGQVETWLDCRYAGQSHELPVRAVSGFAEEHERRNGFARPGATVEVVAIRARVTRASPLAVEDLPTVTRDPVRGPAVVAEADCTVWVPDGWVAEPGPTGAWVMRR
jgi:N-methylhydantoinase A/oxoprolinase/acetone carboxylase beta subunit